MFRLSDKIVWCGTGTLDEALDGAKSAVILSKTANDLMFKHAGWLALFVVMFPDNAPISAENFQALRECLERIITEDRFPVAIVCRAGQERSMAVAAWLHSMVTGCSFDEAVGQAKALRPDGMRHREFQDSLRARVMA